MKGYNIIVRRNEIQNAVGRAKRLREKHPDLPITHIAKIVGVAPITLYRSSWWFDKYRKPVGAGNENPTYKQYLRDTQGLGNVKAGKAKASSAKAVPVSSNPDSHLSPKRRETLDTERMARNLAEANEIVASIPLDFNPKSQVALTKSQVALHREVADVLNSVAVSQQQILNLLKRLI